MGLKDGLMGWWDFNGDLVDAHGDADMTGTFTARAGEGKTVANAIDLDTAPASVMSPNFGSSLTYPFSLAGWVKVSNFNFTAGGAGLVYGYTDVAFMGAKGYRQGSGFKLQMTPNGMDETPELAVNTWHFLAMTLKKNGDNTLNMHFNYDGNTIARLNIVGYTRETFPNLKTYLINTVSVSTHTYLNSYGFWNRELSSVEIATLYNNGAGLEYSDLVDVTLTPVPAVGVGTVTGPNDIGTWINGSALTSPVGAGVAVIDRNAVTKGTPIYLNTRKRRYTLHIRNS